MPNYLLGGIFIVHNQPEVSIVPHNLDFMPFEVIQFHAAWTGYLRLTSAKVDVNLGKSFDYQTIIYQPA
jgi:hypothetical protein